MAYLCKRASVQGREAEDKKNEPDSEVEEPVRSGTHRHLLGTRRSRVNLTGDDPRPVGEDVSWWKSEGEERKPTLDPTVKRTKGQHEPAGERRGCGRRTVAAKKETKMQTKLLGGQVSGRERRNRRGEKTYATRQF